MRKYVCKLHKHRVAAQRKYTQAACYACEMYIRTFLRAPFRGGRRAVMTILTMRKVCRIYTVYAYDFSHPFTLWRRLNHAPFDARYLFSVMPTQYR